jgi:hypothetical protein
MTSLSVIAFAFLYVIFLLAMFVWYIATESQIPGVLAFGVTMLGIAIGAIAL